MFSYESAFMNIVYPNIINIWLFNLFKRSNLIIFWNSLLVSLIFLRFNWLNKCTYILTRPNRVSQSYTQVFNEKIIISGFLCKILRNLYPAILLSLIWCAKLLFSVISSSARHHECTENCILNHPSVTPSRKIFCEKMLKAGKSVDAPPIQNIHYLR